MERQIKNLDIFEALSGLIESKLKAKTSNEALRRIHDLTSRTDVTLDEFKAVHTEVAELEEISQNQIDLLKTEISSLAARYRDLSGEPISSREFARLVLDQPLVEPTPETPEEKPLDEAAIFKAYQEYILKAEAEEPKAGLLTVGIDEKSSEVRKLLRRAALSFNRGIEWLPQGRDGSKYDINFQIRDLNIPKEIPQGVLLKIYDSFGDPKNFFGDNEESLDAIRSFSIDDLDLPIKTCNSFKRAGVKNLYDVLSLKIDDEASLYVYQEYEDQGEKKINHVRQFGEIGVYELLKILAINGYYPH